MRLILIRHAATSDNARSYLGRRDLPLDGLGQRQTEILCAALSRCQVDRVLASPMQRAIQTASPLAATRGLQLELLPELVEIDFGRLEGQDKSQVRKSLRRDHRFEPLPDGESLADVWQRLLPVAATLRSSLEQVGTLAVVGHYWSNRVLLDQLRGETLDTALYDARYKPANASALAVDFKHAAGALSVRDTCWLLDHIGLQAALGSPAR